MKKTIACTFAAGLTLVGLLLGGCASTEVTSENQYLGFLPKPKQVLVYNFAVTPEEVQLDSGVAELDKLAKKESRSEQEKAIGKAVAEVFASHLFAEVQKLGIPAIRATNNPAVNTNDLLVTGQFISIDEGNAAERVVIGLGLGRTDVKTMTQVYAFANGKKILADVIDVDAKSGRKPGMAETLGVGALTGHLAVSAAVGGGMAVGSEAFLDNVNADADRAAKAIAKQIKDLYLNQNWTRP